MINRDAVKLIREAADLLHNLPGGHGAIIDDLREAATQLEQTQDIFIVIQGQYSDKCNIAAFSIGEEAKSFVETMNKREGYGAYEWERVDFNPPLPAVVEAITKPETIHVAKIVGDTIRDGRTFYRVHCSCNYISGPLWSKESANRWKTTHVEGSTW